MAIIVGLDEAGYGPVLGPLVVAAAVFEVPDALAAQDLWTVLSPTVVRRGPAKGGAVWIADSKVVHQGHARLDRLERHVLATCPLDLPLDFTAFTRWLGIPDEHLTAGEPWHHDPFPPLPLAAEGEQIAAMQAKFQAALAAVGGRLAAVCVNLAQPMRYNRMIASTDNKATVLWQMAANLLEKVRRRATGRPVRVTMDKQGGRSYYGPALRQTFPGASVKALRETAQESNYLVETAGATLELRVREKADSGSLEVALASMYAKYVREVFMAQFNRFWQTRAAQVAPTAGYWEDYRRWSAEMAPHLAELNLPLEQYVRSR